MLLSLAARRRNSCVPCRLDGPCQHLCLEGVALWHATRLENPACDLAGSEYQKVSSQLGLIRTLDPKYQRKQSPLLLVAPSLPKYSKSWPESKFRIYCRASGPVSPNRPLACHIKCINSQKQRCYNDFKSWTISSMLQAISESPLHTSGDSASKFMPQLTVGWLPGGGRRSLRNSCQTADDINPA